MKSTDDLSRHIDSAAEADLGQLDIPSPETPFAMPAGMTDKDLERLQALVPLHTLPEARFAELVEDLKFVKASRGEVLFGQGDTDHEHVYLLEGSVALLDKGREIDRVDAGSDTARFPIAHQLPRRNGARAAVPSRLVRIDSRRLSELLARSEHVDYEVSDLQDEADGDWMGQMLRSRILQQIPAANIQNVMMRVERVEFKEGDLIIQQGDPGDAYYMLSSGRALVTRELDKDKAPLELARFGPGDAFGEEALLSDAPRNSTITMLTDGALLRLSKDDFLEFIKRPLLRTLTFEDAEARVEKGAVWLDVRSRAEYETSHLQNSVNLPFEALRYQASSLDRDRQYIACSNTGSQAVSAAFLLTERGFEVLVLRGGLSAAELERQQRDAPESEGGMSSEAQFARKTAEAVARAQALKARLEEMESEQTAVILANQQREDELKQKVERLNLELSLARRQSDALNEAQEHGKDELVDLNERFDLEQSEGRKARVRVSELEVIEIQLRQKVEKLERSLIGERERAEAADEALDSLNRRLSDLQAERDKELDRWQHESGELKEQVTDLQAQIELANQDLREVRSGQTFLASNELGELKQAQQGLLADLKQRGSQLQQTQEAYDQAQRRIAELEQSLQDLGAERQQLLQEKSELSEVAAASGEQTKQQQENWQTAQTRISELEQALAEAGETRQRIE
ncbi:MAG: cyclic nucleotide-binding domain-containing protein, partial [Erythrobacter sp.]|nr:cyclic nucleotide-binding domain-containing protein [Erythrobacter sp.]